MTSLPGYTVPEDMLLGWVSWYTVRDPQVTEPELRAQVTNLGLDLKIMPAAPRAGDAFKRACRYSERSKVPVPMTDNYANFLIRQVDNAPAGVVRQLVIEVVDSKGKTLEYKQPAMMTLDRKLGTQAKPDVQIKKTRLGKPWDDMANDVLDVFAANFRLALKNLDPQTLRRTVRRQLELMSAIAVRREGSVYFIPASQKAKTEGLEQLLGGWNNDSMFHTVPLVDTENQRKMVKAAFEEEVHSEATELIARLAAKIKAGESLTSKAFAEHKTRFNDLVRRAREYGKLVRDETTKANDELNALQSQLLVFQSDGHVVNKRKRKGRTKDETEKEKAATQ